MGAMMVVERKEEGVKRMMKGRFLRTSVEL